MTVTYTHGGTSNFIVRGEHTSGQETLFLANDIGNVSGSGADRVSVAGNYLLTIDANGPWTITVDQPRPTNAPVAPQTYNGSRRQITPFVQLYNGIITVRGSYTGSSNFIVWLYRSDGFTEELVFNEIGSVSKSKAFGVATPGIYYMEVLSSGTWSLTIEQTTGGTPPTPTNTSAPTATFTATPVPTNTPTPTPTPRPQPNCSPRPRVQVSVASTSPDTLTATITATSANNYLTSLAVGTATNARVTVAGQTGTGSFTASIPGFPAAVTITVQRLQSGAPVHVPVVVTDGCGQWSTFVGAGTGVR